MRIEYHPAIEHELREIIDFYNIEKISICYRFLENDVIRILIVKHQRRHPSYGMERK